MHKKIPVGTKSLLFGVHQFIWHPCLVYRAWKELYGKAGWRILVCVILHDIGYWARKEINGPGLDTHPELGAGIAGLLLGGKYKYLCLYHSRGYADAKGVDPSRLCAADKLSIKYEPAWFYLMRARLSGELKLYRNESDSRGQFPIDRTDKEWFNWLKHDFVTAAYTIARMAGSPEHHTASLHSPFAKSYS